MGLSVPRVNYGWGGHGSRQTMRICTIVVGQNALKLLLWSLPKQKSLYLDYFATPFSEYCNKMSSLLAMEEVQAPSNVYSVRCLWHFYENFNRGIPLSLRPGSPTCLPLSNWGELESAWHLVSLLLVKLKTVDCLQTLRYRINKTKLNHRSTRSAEIKAMHGWGSNSTVYKRSITQKFFTSAHINGYIQLWTIQNIIRRLLFSSVSWVKKRLLKYWVISIPNV